MMTEKEFCEHAEHLLRKTSLSNEEILRELGVPRFNRVHEIVRKARPFHRSVAGSGEGGEK